MGWAASRQPTRAEHLLARLEASKRATPKPRSKSPGRESEADRHAELLAAINPAQLHKETFKPGDVVKVSAAARK